MNDVTGKWRSEKLVQGHNSVVSRARSEPLIFCLNGLSKLSLNHLHRRAPQEVNLYAKFLSPLTAQHSTEERRSVLLIFQIGSI